jgi:EAL domain-containing protein (putative c-di-GMP-specific phosphodiesterase class I)
MIWYFECRSAGARQGSMIPVSRLPFRIGRRWDLDLVLTSPLVSWEHAEIVEDQGVLKVLDLGSSNGTSVNGRPVKSPEALAEGDVLQIALEELRLGRASSMETLQRSTMNIAVVSLDPTPAEQAQRFAEMMRTRAVTAVFQPIVSLREPERLGFELLGRGASAHLPESPVQLLEIASRLGAATELSQLFRARGLEIAAEHLPPGSRIFMNTHPAELQDPERLLRSVRDLGEQAPGLFLTLEVHEGAVAGLASLREIRARLHEIGVQLAFDDFGVGQSRLLELGEAPPDVLKFDASLIRDLDATLSGRRTVLSSILRVAADLGVVNVAEGVESEHDLRVCRDLGFDGAQGYFLGRPAPAAALAAML